MNISPSSVIPVTKARGELGKLVDRVSGDSFVILTKEGIPQAALVDVNYLAKLQSDLGKIYQKTYIDPKLLPFTREFSDEEIATWLKEDQL